MRNEEVTALLNDLIETCMEAQDRFHAAAENTTNEEFRRLFNIFSQQRAQFIFELRAEVHRLGGSRRGKEGDVTWQPTIIAESVLQSGEAAMAAECQRGEETAVKDYEKALKADLPLDIQYVLKRQHMDIKDASDRLRILQRAA